MSGCLALTRKWKPCSNYASLEQGETGILRDFTCSIHKGFFDEPESIKEKWFHANQGGYAHYMHISPWTMQWIESCLSTGIVTITREDIEALQPEPRLLRTSPKWSYFFLLCARHVDGFQYSWNPRLWDICVGTLWFWSRRVGAVQITNQDLQSLICVKGGLYEFYKGVELGLKEMSDNDWFQFFDNCVANQPEWFEVFIGIPIEEHKKYVRGVTALARYTAWILTKKKHMFDRHKERVAKTSEELIAVTHHPSRVFPWTFSSEELVALNMRWRDMISKTVTDNVPLAWILREVRDAFSLKVEL